MPLTAIQRSVMAVLRPFRERDNYVAGGAAMNQRWPRLSDDIDIFGDQRDYLPNTVAPELGALRDAGFNVNVIIENDLTVEAILQKDGDETRVQWMDDPETCRRFFPAVPDDELGFQLNQADIAINKVLCAARRVDAPRDAVDLVSIVTRYAPLGPLVWATTAKDNNLTPPIIIQKIRQTAFGYSNEEVVAVRMENGHSMTRDALRDVLGPALDRAADYCDDDAPTDFIGQLFVNSSETPIEAGGDTIATGAASALVIRDFGVVPKIGGGESE